MHLPQNWLVKIKKGEENYRKQISPIETHEFPSRTLAIIKPDAIRNLGDIISAIYENGFTIARMRMIRLSQNEVMYFYSEHKAKDFFP